jgi:hypothetical protein
MIKAIDFTKPLPGTIFKADAETWQIGKRIRAEIQRLYNHYHVEAGCAAQDRKYAEKRKATYPGRGDPAIDIAYHEYRKYAEKRKATHPSLADEAIAIANRREDEAYEAYHALFVAYHKWSGSAQGEVFEAPITPEETALLEAAAH